MTPRGWLLLLRPLGCLVCLSGCFNGTRVPPDYVRDPDPPTPQAVAREQAAAVAADPTPYHVIATAPRSSASEAPQPPPQPVAQERQNRYPANAITPEIKPTEAPVAPPTVPAPPVAQALLCLLDKKRPDAASEAITLLQKYPAANQEYLLQLLPVVARLTEGDVAQAPPQDLGHMLEALDAAATPLRGLAPLSIERICYCKEIARFGEYEPYGEQKAFRPGDLVLLYVEMRNVVSEPTGPGFEVRLASTLEIRDNQDKVVWRQDCLDRNRPERSLAQRHDCYARHKFTLPDNFPPGQYTLRVTVNDLHTHKRAPAQASLPLEVTHRP